MIKTLCIFLFLAGVRSVWLVEPPNNVTIHCQNGTNIAYWNHSGSSTTVLFNVTVKGYNHGFTKQLNTYEHHMDISSITPPVEDEYTLSVAALEGVNKSDEVSVDFTYGRDFPATHICFMALPSPDVTLETSRIQFSFARSDNSNDVLSYTVSTSHDEQQLHLDCPLEAVVCHGEILVNLSSIKNCTTLKLEGSTGGIRYKTSKKICNLVPEKGSWPVVLCVVICVIALATLVGILLSARKVIKSLIEQSSSYVPKSLNPTRISSAPNLLQPEPTITSHAQTGNTPLLQTPEYSPTDSQTVIQTESCSEPTHFPIPACTPPNGVQLGGDYEARLTNHLEHELQPQLEGEEGSDDGYMQRERITDTPDCPYSSSVDEMRDFAIEIAPEDHVSGYGPR